jgi:outer membrane protein assembly factor BamB
MTMGRPLVMVLAAMLAVATACDDDDRAERSAVATGTTAAAASGTVPTVAAGTASPMTASIPVTAPSGPGISIATAGQGASRATAAVDLDAGPAGWCDVGVPTLAAYDRAQGTVRWVRCEDDPAARHDVVGVGDGVVFLRASVGLSSRLVAVDAGDGHDRWEVALGPGGDAVADVGGVVAMVADGSPEAVVSLLEGDSGAVRWSAPVRRSFPPFLVTPDLVIVIQAPTGVGGIVDPTSPPTMTAVAVDRATGAERWSAAIGLNAAAAVVGDTLIASGDVLPTKPGSMVSERVVVDLASGATRARWPGDHRTMGAVVGGGDGVYVVAGQDDDTRAFDLVTGELRWQRPGRMAYDDVAPVGDGAVYALERGAVVAYDLATGATRWADPATPPDVVWPWKAADGVLFAMWTDLAVLSTADGSVIWRTAYPAVEFPRMTGVDADDSTVFVAFSSSPSGGD